MKKILYFIAVILLVIVPVISIQAQSQEKCSRDSTGKLVYCPLEPSAFAGFGGANDSGNLTTFLNQAFQFGLAIAAALAVVMIIWGGVEIMLSESVFTKTEGKKRIQDAIWGLLLALVSWLILWTINPDLLIFKI